MHLDRACPPVDRRLPQGDRGDIVLTWLTKIVVLLSAVGLMAFDAISLGAGHLRAEDQARQAARAAAETFTSSQDLQAAYLSALDQVMRSGDTIDPAGFSIAPDGTVTLTLRHEVPTLLVEKIPPLREYVTLSKTETGRPVG